MSDYWGYHLMLDCGGCNKNIQIRGQIVKFVKDIVERIDMIAHGEPMVEYMLPGDPKQGYSMVQLIETSNICAHFVEPDNTAYFDVFSCKKFDPEVVKKCVREYFAPGSIREHFLHRQADTAVHFSGLDINAP
jgi:S-adenosylmethionine/arginine decarboxylase-like enzyme